MLWSWFCSSAECFLHETSVRKRGTCWAQQQGNSYKGNCYWEHGLELSELWYIQNRLTERIIPRESMCTFPPTLFHVCLSKVESGRGKGGEGGCRGTWLPLKEMSAVFWLRGQGSWFLLFPPLPDLGDGEMGPREDKWPDCDQIRSQVPCLLVHSALPKITCKFIRGQEIHL